jgi:hypothetical protein
MSYPRRIAISVAVVAGGTVGVAVSIWLYQSVKNHGWEGTLRYIWEGEYYPEDIRSALELLEAGGNAIGGTHRARRVNGNVPGSFQTK